MSVKDRLKIFIAAQKMTVSAFEVSIMASNGYVNSISRSIGIDKLEILIENYPNLNITWLLTGNGEMLLPEASFDVNSSKRKACQACKEKDERIMELKDHISTLKDKISSLEKASASKNPPYSQTA